jgi:hypothetical protein
MTEEWRFVPGYEPYQASSLGRIRRADRILRGWPDRDGYWRINTSINCRRKTVAVHTLVLLAFVGPRPSLEHTGAHGPAGISDNSVANLSWKTMAGQHEDQVRDGTDPKGERHPQAVLTDDQVRMIRRRYRSHSRRDGAKAIAAEIGVGYDCIWRVIAGNTWRHVDAA